METPDRLSDASKAKTGPPDLNEWQDFFGRFVIRLVVNGYVSFVLGDIIDELTPAEAKQILLSKDDMKKIAAPFATVATKSKFAQKHGRTIVNLSDSYESIIELVLWMRRVNRIARKHKKARAPRKQNIPQPVYSQENGNANADGFDPGTVNGRAYPVIDVFNPGAG